MQWAQLGGLLPTIGLGGLDQLYSEEQLAAMQMQRLRRTIPQNFDGQGPVSQLLLSRLRAPGATSAPKDSEGSQAPPEKSADGN